MVIGIDARLYQEGLGLGRYIAKILLHLEGVESPHTYVVFLTKKNWHLYEPKNPRFRKVLADIHWYTLAEQFVLPFIFLREKLDILHVPHFNAPIFYPKKYILTIHDLILIKHPRSATSAASTRNPLIHLLKYRAFRFIIRHVVRRASHIIAVSSSVKKDIMKEFGILNDRISVVYESADPLPPAEQCASLPIKENEIFFFYAGNAYPHKNLDVLLDAFQIIAKQYPSVKLFLCGQDDFFRKRITEKIGGMGFASKVTHLGTVSDACLHWLYVHACAYVFPSLEEGFGIPAVEAFAHHCPVLASNIPVLQEVCGDAAQFFDARKPDEIAMAMKDMLEHPEKREQLIKKGAERAGLFSWDRAASETSAIYRRCTELK